MIENFNFTLYVISNDFFITFGIYSVSYLLISIFTKKEILYKLDDEVCKLIIFIGIIYFLVWTTAIFISFSNNESRTSLINRIFGKYWIGFWLQPIIWIAMTQLLIFKKIQKNWFLRLLFSFFFIFSFERIVIITTTLHRDYLPSSWTMYSDSDLLPDYFCLNLILKIILFFVFVGMFFFLRKMIFNYFKKE